MTSIHDALLADAPKTPCSFLMRQLGAFPRELVPQDTVYMSPPRSLQGCKHRPPDFDLQEQRWGSFTTWCTTLSSRHEATSHQAKRVCFRSRLTYGSWGETCLCNLDHQFFWYWQASTQPSPSWRERLLSSEKVLSVAIGRWIPVYLVKSCKLICWSLAEPNDWITHKPYCLRK